jgi:hypothetical protein
MKRRRGSQLDHLAIDHARDRWLNLGLQLLTGGAIVAAIKELGQRVEVVLGPEGESLVERVHKDRVRVRWLAARPKKMEAALQAFNFLRGKGHDTQGE